MAAELPYEQHGSLNIAGVCAGVLSLPFPRYARLNKVAVLLDETASEGSLDSYTVLVYNKQPDPEAVCTAYGLTGWTGSSSSSPSSPAAQPSSSSAACVWPLVDTDFSFGSDLNLVKAPITGVALNSLSFGEWTFVAMDDADMQRRYTSRIYVVICPLNLRGAVAFDVAVAGISVTPG